MFQISSVGRYGATLFTLSIVKVAAMMPRWHDSERICVSGVEGSGKGRQVQIEKTLETHSNFAVTSTWQHRLKLYYWLCNGSSQAKNSNTWDWKHIICNNFSVFTFFRILPNNRVLRSRTYGTPHILLCISKPLHVSVFWTTISQVAYNGLRRGSATFWHWRAAFDFWLLTS
jgi:hypothetical protein